jgi:alkanesulfonate monooxygenase SsuD/methylene tetrahydromethanopterin reductase-like flavin-dependent oxidoreductase (luciferase family)
MKFGLIYDLRNPPQWQIPWPRHYAEFLDHIVELERLGFDEVALPEHHFHEDGYIPSPVPMLAAIATRTTRMRIGSDLFVLPNYHPVRLAEDVAIVDVLSNGRVIFKAGAGGARHEPDGFGFPATSRLGRNAEAIEIIKRCWTEEAFDHHGKYWQLKGVQVVPKPVQKPHPPIYFPALNPKAMERNAREGYGSDLGHPVGSPDPGFWKRWHADWDAALQRHGRTPAECPTSYFITLFATRDPERAWAEHKQGILHVARYYAEVVGYAGGVAPEKPEDIPNWDKLFLTPEDCIKLIRNYFGGAAPDTLVLWGNRPGMSFAQASEHHRLFAEEVMPQVRNLT